jgi:predicted porin
MMKKALVAAALIGTAAAAHAQSSVTLYGRLDNGVEYMNGLRNADGTHTSRWRAESGDWGTAMLGFKGSEDLGGGLKAIFKLESGLNTMNGTAGGGNGRLFQRYALVGLSSPTYGTFQLGRSLFISNGVWDFDPFVQEAWSSASLVRGRNWGQASNTVNYQSPSFYGLDFAGQWAFGNQTSFNAGPASGANPLAGTTGIGYNQGRAAGGQVTWTSSNIMVRGIYDEVRDEFGRFSDLFAFSREYFAGANLTFGAFKVQAGYTHMQASQTFAGAPSSGDHEWLGVTYQFTPAANLTAGGYHINVNKGGGNATMYELGGTYALSKRTFVYLTGAFVHNSSTANFSLNATAPDNAPAFGTGGTINGENPSRGGSQTGAYAGINHTF